MTVNNKAVQAYLERKKSVKADDRQPTVKLDTETYSIVSSHMLGSLRETVKMLIEAGAEAIRLAEQQDGLSTDKAAKQV